MSCTSITHRFLQCIDSLVASGSVKSRRHFALSLGYHAQGVSEMSAGRRDVPLDLIEKAVTRFGLNANYLITGKGSLLADIQSDPFQMPSLSIVTDEFGHERIVHVPVAAQAGYGSLHHDPVFVCDLPSYQLPDPQFKSGTYRSFEIAGASMEPTFRPGDIVIASYVEPRYWTQAIKDGQLYIIVTTECVVIKRVMNQLKTAHCIECISDNPEFQPYTIIGEEIREVWRARLKMTSHLDAETPVMNSLQISQQLQAQHKLLEHLHLQLSQVTHS